MAELKRTFAKEKGRYLTAISRLEKETEEAVLEREGARAGLQKVATSMEVDSSDRMSATVDVGEEFDAIMREGLEIEETAESNEDILRRALQQCDGRSSDARIVVTPPPKRHPVYTLEASTPLQAAGRQALKSGAGRQPVRMEPPERV